MKTNKLNLENLYQECIAYVKDTDYADTKENIVSKISNVLSDAKDVEWLDKDKYKSLLNSISSKADANDLILECYNFLSVELPKL